MYLNRQESESGIGSWDWNLKGDKSTYHALYPRAWTTYEGNIYAIVYSFTLVNISLPLRYEAAILNFDGV